MWSRQAFLEGETLLSELPAIGRSKQGNAVGEVLRPHTHPDAFEVVLVASGQLRWWVEREEVTLSAGMLFQTRPGEAHGAVDESLEPSEIYWTQFRLEQDGAFGLADDERSRLSELLHGASRTGRASDVVRYHYERLLAEHQKRDGRPSLVVAHAVCLLEEALAALAQPVAIDCDPRIEAALRLMRENIGQAFSIPEVAHHVGLSESWFHQLFQRSMGLSAANWLTRERVARAKELLADTDMAITDIALELGFSSSQYFATVFRRQTGRAPRDYRPKSP